MSSDISGKLKVLKMGISRRGSSLNATLEAKDVRLQFDEAFERENGYSFDYVLVFQVHDEAAELSKEQKKFSMRTILQQLARGGIETKMFYSADRGHVFCKLRVTLERLSKEADRVDYKVEFDPAELRKIAETGYEDQNIKKIFIKDDYKITPRDPFQNIFAKFDVEPRLQPAYRKYGHKQTPFRGVDRPQIRFRRVMRSLFFISALIVLVIGVVAGIFVFRIAATSGKWKDMFTVNGMQLGGPAASTVNAIQIMVMNNVYSTVAERLNRYENHRTDTEYEDHLIGKTFLFQFVNSYASLFYVAFIKTSVEGEDSCKPVEHGCMDELMMGLGIIFALRVTSGNFFEVGLPWIMKKLRWRQASNASSQIRREPSGIEQQLGLDVYDQKGTFDDYNEMIIQFGYVTLFVVAFPLAPAMALFNNFFEIRIDAHKLVNATRRPDPRGAQDIGTWGTIIDLMGSIAMVTNVALVCFTSHRTTAHLSTHERLILFVCLEHALILLKYVLMMMVDDEPHDVMLQKQRATFIIDKIVNLIADDDDEEMAKGNQVRVDLTVFDEDI
ncbi:hypothetical protein BBO99_00004563 [Phytophthora kernoviae]|uniref:Anoctamin transmembrane domain-containing protein n=2 Tax=Phytophthora kernoviae TaxID=325452 RepID=A0A3R7G6E7_9STRA|nr:hypothetical protein G195_004972 [Phytophthora kernoviae 00238/432]KAG2525711.1 hypothetical protein JM16_004341 [Phytophthora kernoviae]KAG2527433.1 hypothetical protein JM18_003856 [Phytophthora kernoviae]RLN38245.1 hypothetical protein BBI17_004750 [Phytophthora kernoviae]RLN80351.1 hypothetical protein BBO99_00004563 [Phytophthora kernoviae]